MKKVLLCVLVCIMVLSTNVLSAVAEDKQVPEEQMTDQNTALIEEGIQNTGQAEDGVNTGDEKEKTEPSPEGTVDSGKLKSEEITSAEEPGSVESQIESSASTDLSIYAQEDLAAVRVIMDEIGLTGYDKNDPSTWDFVLWNTEVPPPYRVSVFQVAFRGIPGILDVSGLTELKVLDCPENQFTEIRLGSNSKIERLLCSQNQLTSLDLSGLTNLDTINCSDNQLTSLDVSQQTSMRNLYCSNNQLSTLDLSNLPNLKVVDCLGNNLQSLITTNAVSLENLGCAMNQLTSLDLSTLSALKEFSCNENRLTSLDVSNNPRLTLFICEKNALTALDVSNLTELVTLGVAENQISELNIRHMKKLRVVNCMKNQLTSIDVSGMTSLVVFQNDMNPISTLKTVKGHTINIRQPKYGSILWGGYSVGHNSLLLSYQADAGYNFYGWIGLPSNAVMGNKDARFSLDGDMLIGAKIGDNWQEEWQDGDYGFLLESQSQIPKTGDFTGVIPYALFLLLSLALISVGAVRTCKRYR